MLRRTATTLGLLGVVVLLSSGCGGGSSLPPTYPATGTVVFKGGKSVTGGAIQFTPINDSSYTVSGDVQNDGSFTLATTKGKDRAPGAPEGEYRVTVLLPLPPDQKGIPSVVLPKTYRIEAKDNTFAFEISPPSGRP